MGRHTPWSLALVASFSLQGFYRGGKKVKESQHYPPHLGQSVAKVYQRCDADFKLSFAQLSGTVENFAAGRDDAAVLSTVMGSDLSNIPG